MKSTLNSSYRRSSLDDFRVKPYSSIMVDTEELTTVEAIAGWYRWGKAGGLTRHTINQYASLVQQFFRHAGKEFYDVTGDDLVDWSESLATRGSSVTFAGYKALTSFWKWLRANGLDDRALTDFMPYSIPRLKIPKAFSPSELKAIFEASNAIGGAWGKHAHLYFKFLYFTGARSAEARGVELNDLTSDHVLLRMTKRSSSGEGKERSIPFGADASQLVEPWFNMHRPDWEKRLFAMSPSAPNYWCDLISKRTGIRVHPHKFRATFATTLLVKGIDIRTVQELLGHASIQTTMRYLAVTDERKTAAVAVL